LKNITIKNINKKFNLIEDKREKGEIAIKD